MDLTLHIALLFILGFLFLLVAIYFLMLHILVTEFRDDTSNYSFLLVEIPLTITMLFVSTCGISSKPEMRSSLSSLRTTLRP